MRYQFTGPVTVEGRTFDVGQEIDANEIPAGSLKSCLYVGHVVPVIEKKAAPPIVEASANKPAAKK